MQLGHLFVAGNILILIVEIRRSIQPIGFTVNISAAVKRVGAGDGAHIDVSAAGGSLLRVIHGRVDVKLLNRFRRRRRQSLADRQIRRCRALDDFRCGAAGTGDASIVHYSRRGHLAGALAVEQIAGIDTVQQECVAGVALAIGPDRLIPQSRVYAGSVRQFRVHARRKNRQSRETACR